MGGFAEIESDEVIVLVNNAEIGSEINVQNAEQDLKEAKLAISKFSENEKNPEKIKALKEVSKAEASCLLYTSPSPRDRQKSRMPSSA